jgi:hypothetical protein
MLGIESQVYEQKKVFDQVIVGTFIVDLDNDHI